MLAWWGLWIVGGVMGWQSLQEVFSGGPGTPSEFIRMDALNIMGDGIILVSGVMVVVLIWQVTNSTERKSLG